VSIHINGTYKKGAKVNNINTTSDFDKEVIASFKTDTVTVIRFSGLLDFSSHVNGWLGYSGYGSTSSISQHAILQGGRDSQVLHQHFFCDTDGITRLRYKLSELDPIIMPRLTEPAVRVFKQDKMESVNVILSTVLKFKAPKDWPEKETVKRNIIEHSDLNEQEQNEWYDYFTTKVPSSIDDLSVDNCLKWSFPTMVSRKRNATISAVESSTTTESPAVEMVVTQQSLAGPSTFFGHEILIHEGHTASQAAIEKKIRQNAHQQTLKAAREKDESHKTILGMQNQGYGTIDTSVPSSQKRKTTDTAPTVTNVAQSKKRNIPGATVSSKSTITVGDLVLSVGDDVVSTQSPEWRESTSGNTDYSICNISDVNPATQKVHVQWYYPKCQNGFWIKRYHKDGSAFEDWIDAASLVVDSANRVLKLNLYELTGDDTGPSYLLDSASAALFHGLKLKPP
jgi:hypothetical protein